MPASTGAVAALVVATTLGLLVHRPLARVSENTLNFVVGALLCAFGVFWVGEGMGDAWPGGDWAVPVLIAVWLAMALLCARLVRIRIADQRAVA